MIARRSILSGFSAVAAARPLEALAATRCLQQAAWGYRTCETGVEHGLVETARQECDSWCWAACIQTIFAVHGRPVSQEQVSRRLFGSDRCQGANIEQIIGVISGNWVTANSVPFRASARLLPRASLAVQISGGSNDNRPAGYMDKAWAAAGDTRELIGELDAGRPLINLAVGHATVLTSVTYQRNELLQAGPAPIIKLVVRDPWKDNANRRELTVREVQGTFFVVAVSVS